MASAKFLASAKFFEAQAEKCGDLARRTHDEDCRDRYERLQHVYRHLAEMEDQKTAEAPGDPTRRPAA